MVILARLFCIHRSALRLFWVVLVLDAGALNGIIDGSYLVQSARAAVSWSDWRGPILVHGLMIGTKRPKLYSRPCHELVGIISLVRVDYCLVIPFPAAHSGAGGLCTHCTWYLAWLSRNGGQRRKTEDLTGVFSRSDRAAVELTRKPRDPGYCVIIDGRIADITKSGFLEEVCLSLRPGRAAAHCRFIDVLKRNRDRRV